MESMKRRKIMEFMKRRKIKESMKKVDIPTPITESWMSMPLDIIMDILSKLPVKTLSRFKCVSKSWYNLLTRDSSFISMHLDRSTRDKHYHFLFSSPPRFYSIHYSGSGPQLQQPSPEALNSPFPLDDNRVSPVIIGDSCRGVFLIGDSRTRSILFLWNPATQEHKKLPDSLIQFPGSLYNCGLGYDDSTGDFKVVIVYYRYMYDLESRVPHYESGWEVCIYSLRSNTVKRIQYNPYLVHNNLPHDDIKDISWGIFDLKEAVNGGIFAVGAIHWLLKAAILTSFNVSSEEYKQLPIPDFITKIGHHRDQNYSVGELKDFLCLTVSDHTDLIIHVFVTQDCAVWTNLFTLHPDQYFDEFCSLSWFNSIHKSIIFEWFISRDNTGRLTVYEAEDRSTKCLVMPYFPYAIPRRFNSFMFYRAYVQSLVSLEPITFVEEN